MRHTFESLGYQSGFYLSHLFSSTRNTCSSSSSSSSAAAAATAATTALCPPPPLVNWPHHRPPLLPSATTSINLSSPTNFHHSSSTLGLLIPQPKDQTHLFLHNHLSDGTATNNNKLFLNPDSNPSASEFLSSDNQQERKMNRFKRSFTLPARVASSSSPSSSSMDHHNHNQQQQPVDYRNSEGGLYQDVMGTFLE